MNILLISYYWRPSANVGVLRAWKFAEYLRRSGHDVSVLTAQKGCHFDPRGIKIYYVEDPLWHDKLLRGIKKVKSVFSQKKKNKDGHNLKKRYISENKTKIVDFRGLASFPERTISWLFNSYRLGIQIVKKNGAQLIISTSPPIVGHLSGFLIKKKTGVKHIVDFRDPWANYHQDHVNDRLSLFLRERLEQFIFLRSDQFCTVSKRWRVFFYNQYKRKGFVVYNCYQKDEPRNFRVNSNKLTFVYTGKLHRFYQNPESFLRALSELLREKLIGPDKISVDFYTYGYYSPDFERLIEHYQLNSVVHIYPKLPFEQALEKIKKADVCLLFDWQGHCPTIDKGVIPVKFFDYLRFRKPVFLLNATNGELSCLLKKTGLGRFAGSIGAMKSNILTYIKEFTEDNRIHVSLNDQFVSRFSCGYQIGEVLNYNINRVLD